MGTPKTKHDDSTQSHFFTPNNKRRTPHQQKQARSTLPKQLHGIDKFVRSHRHLINCIGNQMQHQFNCY
eukprot:scaffold20552_cov161-Skeletonema_dohrnii-CCMP3373.AAC.5